MRIIKNAYPDAYLVAVRRGTEPAVEEAQLVDEVVRNPVEAIRRNVEGAIIASPAPFHVDHAIEFLTNGVPVLIEKPLSSTLHDALRLDRRSEIGTARQRSLLGYVLRYEPAYDTVEKILNSQELGVPRSVRVDVNTFLPDWRPGQDYLQSVSAQQALGGGVLRELSHELDYINELFGPIRSVVGWRNSKSTIGIDTEEHVELLMIGAEDTPVSVVLDFATQAPARRQAEIEFDRAVLVWDLTKNRVATTSSEHTQTVADYPAERDDLFTAQFNHFLKCMAGEQRPRCTIDHGISVMALIDAIERSFQSGKWEPVA